MAIIEYEAGTFARDTDVAPPNVYIPWLVSEDGEVHPTGQGCGTVWYYSVPDARRALEANGGVPPHGSQSGLCKRCRGCHSRRPDLPDFACREWKAAWTNLQKKEVKDERTGHGA